MTKSKARSGFMGDKALADEAEAATRPGRFLAKALKRDAAFFEALAHKGKQEETMTGTAQLHLTRAAVQMRETAHELDDLA